MRYVLIDRILTLAPGHSLDALKAVSLSDDLVTRYGAGFSALPGSMVLEAMAQAAGLLVVASLATPAQPVLAKVQPFTSHRPARPGDAIAIHAELEELRPEGCRARVAATVNAKPLAEATIYLALVPLQGDDAPRAAVMRAALADTFPEWFAA